MFFFNTLFKLIKGFNIGFTDMKEKKNKIGFTHIKNLSSIKKS